MGVQAGRSLEVQGLWLQQPRCSDEGRKDPLGAPLDDLAKVLVTAESGQSSKGSQPRGETSTAGVVPMKTMDARERLQTVLQEIEHVVQALRVVNNDPVVAQLLV